MERTQEQKETLKHNLGKMSLAECLGFYNQASKELDFEGQGLVYNELEQRTKQATK